MNYLAILIAAVVSYAVGWMWHGPLFGKMFMRLSKITPEQMEKGKAEMKGGKMGKTIAIGFLFSIITAFVLEKFVYGFGAVSVANAFELAFWVWFGFQLTVLANGYLWEGKSGKLFSFNFIWQFVFVLIQALILVKMQ